MKKIIALCALTTCFATFAHADETQKQIWSCGGHGKTKITAIVDVARKSITGKLYDGYSDDGGSTALVANSDKMDGDEQIVQELSGMAANGHDVTDYTVQLVLSEDRDVRGGKTKTTGQAVIIDIETQDCRGQVSSAQVLDCTVLFK